MLHTRSKIPRSTIWNFATRGDRIQVDKIQALCDVLAGWDMPAPPALSFRDFLAVPGRQRSTARRTGIQVIHLTRASRGLSYLTQSEKVRLLRCYPGLITPGSIPERPDQCAAKYIRPTLAELDVIEQMDNEVAIEARRKKQIQVEAKKQKKKQS